MLEALEEVGLQIDHSEIWKKWHEEGVFEDIEKMIRKNLFNHENNDSE